MERKLRGPAAIVGFCFFLALILFITATTVCNIAGDGSLMAVEMRRYSSPKVSGLPDEQYPEMGRMITDYLTGKRDTFQYYFTDKDGNMVVCFSPHEEDHMADCRGLIRKTGTIRWIAAGAALILFVAVIVLRKQRKSLGAGMIAGFILTALVCGIILAWGIIRFDNFFTAFHRLLFTNDGWQLNPQTDMLIRLMPTSFFMSLGIKLLLAIAAVALAALSAAVILRTVGNGDMEEEKPEKAAAVQEA